MPVRVLFGSFGFSSKNVIFPSASIELVVKRDMLKNIGLNQRAFWVGVGQRHQRRGAAKNTFVGYEISGGKTEFAHFSKAFGSMT